MSFPTPRLRRGRFVILAWRHECDGTAEAATVNSALIMLHCMPPGTMCYAARVTLSDEARMDSDTWHRDRKAAEALLVALAGITSSALKTLQTAELERIIVLLATTTAICGAERQQR